MRMIGYVSIEANVPSLANSPQLNNIFQCEVIEIGKKNTQYNGSKYLICSAKVEFDCISYNREFLEFIDDNFGIFELAKHRETYTNPLFSIAFADVTYPDLPSLLIDGDVLRKIGEVGLGLEIWSSLAMPEVQLWSNVNRRGAG